MTTRTGSIGDCYEFHADGKRLAATDRMTVEGMVALSAQWPDTWHQYRGTNGHVVWAHAGREIAATELPSALR